MESPAPGAVDPRFDQANAERALGEAVELIEASRHIDALELIDYAEQVFTSMENWSRVLAARQRRFMVYALVNRLDEAIDGNRELVGLYLDRDDDVRAAKVRTNLGFNLNQAGDGRGAATQYRAAIRTFKKYPKLGYELATAYMNLSIVLTAPRPKASARYAERARQLFEQGGHLVKAGDCTLLIARHADKRGDHSAADVLRSAARATYLDAEDVVRAAHATYLTGSAAGRRGRYAQAVEYLSDALRTFLTVAPPTQVELADCARRVAMSYRALGDNQRALTFALFAVVVLNGVRGSLREPRLRTTWRSRRGSTYSMALRLAADLGESSTSLVLVEATRAQQAPAIAATDRATADEASAPAALESEQTHEGLGGTRGRKLRGQSDGAPASAMSAEALLTATGIVELARLPRFVVGSQDPLEPTALATRVADLLGIATGTVTFQPPDTGEVVDLAALARAIGGDDALWWSTVAIDDHIFWATYAAAGSASGYLDFDDGSALRAAVDTVEAGLPDENGPSAASPLQRRSWEPGGTIDVSLGRLSGLVPRPVREVVVEGAVGRPVGPASPRPAHDTAGQLSPTPTRSPSGLGETTDAPGTHQGKRVIVHAPAADLAGVPLMLVPASPNGPRILEGAALVYCPSPALSAASRRFDRTREMLNRPVAQVSEPLRISVAVVDPTTDLPQVRRLAHMAVAAVGTPRFPWRPIPSATRAHVSELLRTAASSSDSVFLYAGHSTAGSPDDPLDAGLLLRDGQLTARELLTTPARDEFPFPDRVMFASCSSAGLTHQDWTGLATASSWLGAKMAVASLWPLSSSREAVHFDQIVTRAFASALPIQELRHEQHRMLQQWQGTSIDSLPRRAAAVARDPRLWLAYVMIIL